ncbi:hypothetical protein GCM10009551_093800 [Nocardiopsis tropica]
MMITEASGAAPARMAAAIPEAEATAATTRSSVRTAPRGRLGVVVERSPGAGAEKGAVSGVGAGG